LLGEILVECGQKSEESGVAQQGVPHWRPPVGVGISGDQPPPELASSSVRGLFAVGKSRRKSDYARSAAGKEPRILITFRDGKSSNPSPILIRNRALPIDLCDCSDTAVIGLLSDDDNGESSGSAYVFNMAGISGPNPVPSISFGGLALLAGMLLATAGWLIRWRRVATE
jgi:hypothetical protein